MVTYNRNSCFHWILVDFSVDFSRQPARQPPYFRSEYANEKAQQSSDYQAFPSVGVTGFEPATTRPPDVYSNRTELRPDSFGKKEQNPSLWDCKYSIFFKNKHISAGFFSIFAEMKRFSRLLLTFSAALASACGGSSGPVLSDFTTEIYTPAYASGFDIRGNGNNASTLVSIRNPWQGGTNVEQHL